MLASTALAGLLGGARPIAACARPGAAVASAARPRVAPSRAAAPPRAAAGRDVSARAATAESANGASTLPEPVVRIDNESDSFATVVTVEFGDRLGELLDTVKALQGLGLNIRRAKIAAGGGGAAGRGHKFFITDARTSEKVVKSERIEAIRLVILNNMLEYHPESGEKLAWGSDAARGGLAAAAPEYDPLHPLGARTRRPTVTTAIEVRDSDDGSHSELLVNTTDRPGLLTDIVRVLKDINLNVVSAEVDTIGRNAVDKFNVTYHGEPLPPTMVTLVTNALAYYLSRDPGVEKPSEESY